ncbi:MAG: hypothetical protein ACLFVU_09375 [Phycisphaerae bacterium]
MDNADCKNCEGALPEKLAREVFAEFISALDRYLVKGTGVVNDFLNAAAQPDGLQKIKRRLRSNCEKAYEKAAGDICKRYRIDRHTLMRIETRGREHGWPVHYTPDSNSANARPGWYTSDEGKTETSLPLTEEEPESPGANRSRS